MSDYEENDDSYNYDAAEDDVDEYNQDGYAAEDYSQNDYVEEVGENDYWNQDGYNQVYGEYEYGELNKEHGQNSQHGIYEDHSSEEIEEENENNCYSGEHQEANEYYNEQLENNDDEDGPVVLESSNDVNAQFDTVPSGGSEFRGLLDGFGASSFGDVVGSINSMGGDGILSNMFSKNGGMESMMQNMIASAAHRFLNVDPSTGHIIGSVLGNLFFNMGGQSNSLSSVGKVILDNIISGKFRRNIQPFSPTIPGHVSRNSFFLDFQTERQRCLQERRLFEDPEFSAQPSSIWYNREKYDSSVQWLRPGEITEQPQLIVEEKSRFDVKQGELGDCWLLAAAANLTLRDEMFYRVVPPDQSFTENYAGIFHFQFWRYGKWVDVVIDDRLPCRDGRLIYMHSQNLNEFWSALLEKAYAKLYGSYEHLDGGAIVEALEDFTGGLTESMSLKKTDKSIVLAMIIRGIQMGSLFGCSIHARENEKEAKLDNGLVCGHAYSITSIKVLSSLGDYVIIRLRNPWGNSKEWNGAWSDGSQQWNRLPDYEKREIDLNFSNDGEFWMSFDDFISHFDEIEVCNLSADVMSEISEMTGINLDPAATKMQTWDEKMEEGEWNSSHGTAGGCLNYPESYGQNPQFASYFEVTSDYLEADGKCTVIVAVLQKYRREMRNNGLDNLPIGFSIYQVDNGYGQNRPLPFDYFTSHKPVAKTKTYINQREMTLRARLTSGRYIIVPTTFEPNQDGQFLLRIFANSRIQTIRLR